MTPPKATVSLGMRTGWFKHVGVAVGGASGAALVLGFYRLLNSQPDKSFALMQAWGPAFVLGILALFIAGQFLQSLVGAVVASGDRQAEAASRTADALSKLAEQGGRQAEEVRRLAIYAGRELGAIAERFDKQDLVMGELVASVRAIHARLDQTRTDQGRLDQTRIDQARREETQGEKQL